MKMPFFPVHMSQNTYSYSCPSWGSNWTHAYLKKIMVFLKLNFQDESHLHANCLFCILILCCKCIFFQFLYCDIRKHIFIIIGAQNGRISCWKIVIFFWKISFWSLISKNNISCMLIACFIFCLFTVSYFVSLPFFFSS